MSLTIDELKEKIKQVEKDIEALRSAGDTSRKLEVLCEYQRYLEEELQFIKSES